MSGKFRAIALSGSAYFPARSAPTDLHVSMTVGMVSPARGTEWCRRVGWSPPVVASAVRAPVFSEGRAVAFSLWLKRDGCCAASGASGKVPARSRGITGALDVMGLPGWGIHLIPCPAGADGAYRSAQGGTYVIHTVRLQLRGEHGHAVLRWECPSGWAGSGRCRCRCPVEQLFVGRSGAGQGAATGLLRQAGGLAKCHENQCCGRRCR